MTTQALLPRDLDALARCALRALMAIEISAAQQTSINAARERAHKLVRLGLLSESREVRWGYSVMTYATTAKGREVLASRAVEGRR